MKRWIFLLLIVFLVGCTAEVVDEQSDDSEAILEEGEDEVEMLDWKAFELTDVQTGETFSINDFEGTPILLESFAVWCPKCTSQQENIKELHELVGDDVVSISLDTDPNEDVDLVLEHIEEHGFDWLYAISPTDMTDALIDEFGFEIVSAPSVPVILICEDGNNRLLDSGVKSVEELQEEIAAGC